jgi:NAD(P)-dependent dehydrogenase (short-subunit alcohol dehydrogenase family)
MKSIGGTSSMERAGQPAELASIYVQLASTEANYMTSAIYGAAGVIGQP